jgi:6-phosphofructokinase
VAELKKIGVLTSGGDCPGLNAVIRAVVKCAHQKGWEVYGIPYGTDGFMGVADGIYAPDDLKFRPHGYDVPGMLQGIDILQFLSGSILGSLSRGHPKEEGVIEKVLSGYAQLGLDALVVIGGDGSLDIIYDFAQMGQWDIIAIPKTIDNDVPYTERSIGFDTAVNTVTNALYDLTFTAASHDRVMVVQVMGRDAGHLPLHGGIAGGADVILIPERVPMLSEAIIDQICRHIAVLRQEGRKFALVVVAEGIRDASGQKVKYIGDLLAQHIREQSCVLCATGDAAFCDLNLVDTRATTLGHIQRSGTPTSSDRLLATAFGKQAIELIAAEKYQQLLVWVSGAVQTRPLTEVIPVLKELHQARRCPSPVQPDDFMVGVAQALGIFIG